MPINAFSAMAAAKGAAAAAIGFLLVLAGCSGPQGPQDAASLPMRVAGAPEPPRTAQSLDEAVLSMTVALFDRARIAPPEGPGGYSLVVDPLIDRATGEQSATTRRMEQRIGAVVRERYPEFRLRPFNTAALEERPLILLGSITGVDGAGIIPPAREPRPQTYRIWAVLGDLRTGKVVAHETAWVRGPEIDTTPAPFYADSPAWTSDGVTAAYLRTCAGNPGDPIDPAYLAALEAQALISDGTRAYEEGNYPMALASYDAASRRPGGDQLRVRNGLYLSNRALGRRREAEEAFGAVVDHGLDRGKLAVKFLFQPGTTRFAPSRDISGDYPMWIRQIARRAAPRDVCLAITGHASPTGASSVNQRLSAGRAEAVRSGLVAERAVLRPRTEAAGLGASRPLIGTGKDDVTDALDRRVEFEPSACPMRVADRL
ncbi:OmpA family protein [Muricoccus pecuniae]|uniref:OmpA-like domain-containing protein n=1 Tax=Muricoccus pecuniae TaxID=693023 RepID=A0A840YDP2_9PROT|nr:OmpA family protein [Roseomonas pecuniae]MBB5694487.1 hypothetical protein [Roseomonas pecuniae]